MANLSMDEWLKAANEGGCGCVQVAKAFDDIDRRIFTRWMESGRLPAIKVFCRWWCTVDGLKAFMATAKDEVIEARRVTAALRSIRKSRKPAKQAKVIREAQPAC